MRKIDLSGKTVLVADDELIIRELLEEHLQAMGAVVLAAADGEEAWKLAEGNKVDLVLSDVRMPGGGGNALLEKFKASGSQAPFFFLTGFADCSPEDARAQGARATISKPFKIQALNEIISEALGLKKAA